MALLNLKVIAIEPYHYHPHRQYCCNACKAASIIFVPQHRVSLAGRSDSLHAKSNVDLSMYRGKINLVVSNVITVYTEHLGIFEKA